MEGGTHPMYIAINEASRQESGRVTLHRGGEGRLCNVNCPFSPFPLWGVVHPLWSSWGTVEHEAAEWRRIIARLSDRINIHRPLCWLSIVESSFCPDEKFQVLLSTRLVCRCELECCHDIFLSWKDSTLNLILSKSLVWKLRLPSFTISVALSLCLGAIKEDPLICSCSALRDSLRPFPIVPSS